MDDLLRKLEYTDYTNDHRWRLAIVERYNHGEIKTIYEVKSNVMTTHVFLQWINVNLKKIHKMYVSVFYRRPDQK